MRSHEIVKAFLVSGLALGGLGLGAPSAGAADHYLIAKPVDLTMPGGTIVPMWGFARDDGSCYAIQDGGGPNSEASKLARVNAAECQDPAASVPGPRLTVPAGDTDLRVFLVNLLTESTSVVVPGQEMPVPMGPTWGDGSVGARPSAAARVRSFGVEVAANGGRQQYGWTEAVSDNAFQAGTFLYESGTHPQVQVQMGLYGAVTRNAAVGQAYAGIGFDAERDLFFSEVDPALHAAVVPGPFSGSTLGYKPRFFLLNGYDGSGNPVDVTIGPDPLTDRECIDSGLVEGDRILLRLYNAGLRELAPMLIGSHFDAVAEGGRAYPFARRQYEILLMPGSTQDLVFTPGHGGDFPLVERRLNLTDAAATGGGMQACLQVAAGANLAPTANPGGPYAGFAGIPIAFDGSASSDGDGDPLSYSWDFDDGAMGSGVTPSHAYAVGSYMASLVVNDGSVNSPSVATSVAVAANLPPTADAGGSYDGRTGFAVAFDASGSMDPELQSLSYAWDFGDGDSGSGAMPTHAYAAPGSYDVSLVVGDGFQSSAPDLTSATVIDNSPPLAALSAPAQSPDPTVTIDGCGSSDANSDGLTYGWDFGDGSTASTADPECSVSHAFAAEGSYTVTLVVNDGFVDSALVTTNVTISTTPPNVAPVANADAFNPDQLAGIAEIPDPGVLANDSDADAGPAPLQAVLVQTEPNLPDQHLVDLSLAPDGSFAYAPGNGVGVYPFYYQASDGSDASAPTLVQVTREIWVRKAEFTGNKNRWNIQGDSTRPGGTVTVYLGPSLGGPVIGTAVVTGSGSWSLTVTTTAIGGPAPPPNGFDSISVDDLGSAGGAVEDEPIRFQSPGGGRRRG